jgi:hypothetical protein
MPSVPKSLRVMTRAGRFEVTVAEFIKHTSCNPLPSFYKFG